MQELIDGLRALTDLAKERDVLEVAVVTCCMAAMVANGDSEGLSSLGDLAAELSKRALREIELEKSARRN